MDRSRVGIVIPALNESITIVDIIKVAGMYGVPIVVNDGSTDDTAALALQAGAVVVSHEANCGYDVTLNSGFRKASELGCEIIITMDADGQHDPSLIREFIAAIEGGADVVVGIRSHRQRFAEHLFAWYTWLRFGVKDPLCGMKAYRAKVHDLLGYFDSYESIGTELLIVAAKRGCRVSQIPFIVRDRKDQSRFGHMLLGNYKIFRAMLLSLWRAK